MGALSAKLLPLYANKLANFATREDYEIVDAMCMLTDCMEYGPESLFQMIAPQALDKFTEIMQVRGSDNQDLTQTGVFGLGVIAQRIAPAEDFRANLTRICQAVNWVYD